MIDPVKTAPRGCLIQADSQKKFGGLNMKGYYCSNCKKASKLSTEVHQTIRGIDENRNSIWIGRTVDECIYCGTPTVWRELTDSQATAMRIADTLKAIELILCYKNLYADSSTHWIVMNRLVDLIITRRSVPAATVDLSYVFPPVAHLEELADDPEAPDFLAAEFNLYFDVKNKLEVLLS